MSRILKKPIYVVAGARPNFMKIAPLIKEFQKEKINFKLIHTGQHYDYNMSKVNPMFILMWVLPRTQFKLPTL